MLACVGAGSSFHEDMLHCQRYSQKKDFSPILTRCDAHQWEANLPSGRKRDLLDNIFCVHRIGMVFARQCVTFHQKIANLSTTNDCQVS